MVSFEELSRVERFSERKYFFRIQKIGWRFIGFWPGSDNVSTFQLALAILNGLEVLIYCACQFSFCYENRGNLVIILDALTPAITQFTSAMKIFFIVYNRREIFAILRYLSDSFESGNEVPLSLIDFYSSSPSKQMLQKSETLKSTEACRGSHASLRSSCVSSRTSPTCSFGRCQP